MRASRHFLASHVLAVTALVACGSSGGATGTSASSSTSTSSSGTTHSVGSSATSSVASSGSTGGSDGTSSSSSAGAGGATSSGGTSTSGSSTSSSSTSSSSTSGGGSSTSSTGAGGGSTSSSGAGGGCTTQPTFAEVLAKPLSNCAGFEPPCHNAGAGNLKIDPTNAKATWKQLVNVPTYNVGGGIRVVPGDPADSFLYKKLTNTQGPGEGSPMPMPAGQTFGDAGPPQWMELPAPDIEMVRCWIASGAKDN